MEEAAFLKSREREEISVQGSIKGAMDLYGTVLNGILALENS
jgi:hypothetical protein